MTRLGWQGLLLILLPPLIYGLWRSLRAPKGGSVRALRIRFLTLSILVHAGLLFALDLVLITIPVVAAHKGRIGAAIVKTFSMFPTGLGGPGPSWERLPEGPPPADPAAEPVEARAVASQDRAFDPALAGIAPTISDDLARSLPAGRVLFLPRPSPSPGDSPPSELPRAPAVMPEWPKPEPPPLDRVEAAPEAAPEAKVDPIARQSAEPRPADPAPMAPPAAEPRLPVVAHASVLPIPPAADEMPAPLAQGERRLPPALDPEAATPATPARVATGKEAPASEPALTLARSEGPAPAMTKEAPRSGPLPRADAALPLPAAARLPEREPPTGTLPDLVRLPVARAEERRDLPPAVAIPPLPAKVEPFAPTAVEAPEALPRTVAKEVELTQRTPPASREAPRLDPPLRSVIPPPSELRPRLDALPPPLPAMRLPASGEAVAVAIGRPDPTTSFLLREPEVRKELVKTMGGTEASEAAVERGLAWLVAHQAPAGNWSLEDLHCQGHRCEAPGNIQSNAAATGLALMALLGAGHSPTKGAHAAVVRRGVEWLVAHQKPDGSLTEPGGQQQLYAHALATIALCEALGLGADPALREPASRAVGFIVQAQDPNHGGWRYQPRTDGDTSVVGWQLMALKSAEMAGLPVPADTYRLAAKWLDSVATGPQKHLYAYQPNGEVRPSMTAEALLCRQYLGTPRTAESMVAGGLFLRSNLPDWNARHTYYWYYATQVMYHLQGEAWAAWNAKLRDMLVDAQDKDGPSAGSWHPLRPTPDNRGEKGGRLYETTMSLLILEVYYRHLPLYQQLSDGEGR